MTRLGVWAAIAACWIAGSFLGMAGVALRTEVGRELVSRTAVGLLNDRINGRLTMGELDGSFIDGLEIHDIVLRGPNDETVIALDRLQLRYRLADLLSRRIVLGQLILERPRVNLTQSRPGAPFTLGEVFASDSGGGGGSTFLIAFNDVQIRDGSLLIRTPADSMDPGVVEGEVGAESYLRLRRIEGITAEFDYLRVSSPRPEDRGLLANISRLGASVSDPAVSVANLAGRARLVGDSLEVDLSELHLAETRARARGALVFRGGLSLDLDVEVDPIVTDELRALIPELPAGLRGSANVRVNGSPDGVLRTDARELDLAGIGGGGDVRGRLGILLRPGGNWAFRDTDLDLRTFDLEYVRGFLDTLPVAGRLTGNVKAVGPKERLAVEIDVVLRDSLVEGWPESQIRGAGDLRLDEGLVFDGFRLRNTRLDLATVRRMLPSIQLLGSMLASGTLNGPWNEMRFNGTLRHRHAPGPESLVRGTMRVDATGDPVGVWADVFLDSLRFEGLRSSYPAIIVGGSFAGRVLLSGYMDSLQMDARLAGPAGRIAIDGAVLLYGGDLGAHDVVLGADQVNLERLHPKLPPTAVNGDIRLAGVNRPATPPRWTASVALSRSLLRDVPLDSVLGRVVLGDTLLRVDTLDVWTEGMYADAHGAIGLEAPHRGVLVARANADSIGVFEPLMAALLGQPDSALAALPPSGAVAIAMELRGALDAYELEAQFEARDMRRADIYVSRLSGNVRWRSPFVNAVLDANLDSLRMGGLSFSGLEARVRGHADSMGWFARARFGSIGSWIAGGQLLVDTAGYMVPLDSMAFLLPTGAWFLDSAATVAASDSGIDFGDLTLRSATGAARVSLDGRLPLRGPASLQGTFEAVSLGDVAMLLQRFSGELDGELSGRLRLGGIARAPTIEATASLRDGVFQTLRIPFLDGEIDYRDQHLSGAFALWRRGERFVEVDVQLPIDLALTAVERRQLPGELTVRAVADSMPLSFVEAVVPVIRRSSGTATADVAIRGSWEEPELAGRVTIRDGATSFPALGVRHERLNGTLVLTGETIRIEEFSLRSGRGTAQVSGTVTLEELTSPRLDLRISARDFHAVNLRDFLNLNATGELELTGPPLGAVVTGSGTATRGEFYFADLITKQVINLEDTLFASFVDTTLIREQRLGTAFTRRFLDSLRVQNLSVSMGNDVWLRSSEANIQLAGNLTVNKARNEYRMTGTLVAQRGTYRLPLGPVTREFTVTRGEVRYFGTTDLDADVDIDAQHVVRTARGEDVTVFVHIGGTVYDPRLTLSSDFRPALSEPEIINYLLFGAPSLQALTTDTRGQNSGIGDQAVSQLAGVLSGQLEYALISDLGVPLDYVQIRPGDIGRGLSGTEIAIGKQFTLLGTTAFLTASPRICPRQAFSAANVGASLEFRLTRHWLFAASADPLRGCDGLATSNLTYQFGLDLLWEKSY